MTGNGMPTCMRLAAVALALFTVCGGAQAGEANVVGVKVQAQGETYRFDVTVRHGDEGWDHYADRWVVVGDDGTVFGERVLLHPHVEEQPFTRSLSGVVIPEGVNSVAVRGHDKGHGFGGAEFTIDLNSAE